MVGGGVHGASVWGEDACRFLDAAVTSPRASAEAFGITRVVSSVLLHAMCDGLVPA